MKKVLIVEDQRMPRENMERILLDSGKYKLCASVNGADVALAVCRREKIDLILMVCVLPVIKTVLKRQQKLKQNSRT